MNLDERNAVAAEIVNGLLGILDDKAQRFAVLDWKHHHSGDPTPVDVLRWIVVCGAKDIEQRTAMRLALEFMKR